MRKLSGMKESSPRLVRDLMTVGVATCPPDAELQDLARLFIEKGLEAVVVLDPDDGNALGVISQDNLVTYFSHQTGQKDIIHTAADVMAEGVPQVPPDIPLEAAAQIMRDQGVRALFLMHHAGGIEYPAGVITYTHILRYLAARDESELRDLGIQAARQSPLEAFIQRRDDARKRVQNRAQKNST